jgi:hypothetical protein
MLEFFKKFFYHGFEAGDFTWGVTHILSIVCVIASVVVFSLLLRNKDEKYIYGKMKIIAVIGLLIYFTRRSLALINKPNILELYWPFYLCNINTIFLSLTIIFNIKTGRDFFLVTGLIGGLFTFLIPDGIFTDRYLTFPILDSIMSHYVIVVIPLVLLLTKAHTLRFKNIYQVFIGLLIVIVNVELVQGWLFKKDFDYLFFRGTIPFTIPNVPQFIIISFLAVVLILLVYYLDNCYLRLTEKKNV